MAWVEVHQSLWDHRKTLAVADALDMPELYAAAHLIALWTWAIDNAPDGILPASRRIIARGAKWTGDADAFIEAVVSAGFLDVNMDLNDERTYLIHDWDTYVGKLIAQRRANAERQKRHRERGKGRAEAVPTAPTQTPPVTSPPPAPHVTVTPAPGSDTVTVTSPSRNPATVPYPTQPNQENGVPTEPAAPAAEPTPIPAQPVDAETPKNAPPSSGPPPSPPKPRTAKQQASDALFERRSDLFAAYCRGLGIDLDSFSARERQPRAFRELTPALKAPEIDPDVLERLTRYTIGAYQWRHGKKLPAVVEVLAAYAEWDQAGQPEAPIPKPTPITRTSSGRPRGGMTPEDMAAYARRLEAEGQ